MCANVRACFREFMNTHSVCMFARMFELGDGALPVQFTHHLADLE